jgi:outer membrane protein TolC
MRLFREVKMRRSIFFCWAFFFVTILFSEPVVELNINRAIDLALKNNTGYLISKEEVKQSKYRVRKNMGFLPQITLEGARILDEKLMEIEMPSIIPGAEPTKVSLDFTKNYEFTLQLVQPIFTGGKIWYAFKNAKIDLKIAKERLKNTKEALILNVKKVFFNVLVLKELLKTHYEALQLAERNYQNVKERFELGMVSKYDLLRAELSVSTIKPQILNAQKLIQIMTANLKVMIGLSENVQVKISGQLDYNEKQLEISTLIKEALTNRSEIHQLKMELEKTTNLLKMTWAQYIPDFSLIASYSYRSDNFKFTAGNWENFYTISLGIRFPIFTGFRRSAEIGEIKVLRKMLAMNVKELNDATRIEILDLYYTVKEEYEKIELGLKNIETASEGVRIADLNYKEGLITILELNSSYNGLTQAKVSFIQAVYNYKIALAKLEKVTGINIIGGEQ